MNGDFFFTAPVYAEVVYERICMVEAEGEKKGACAAARVVKRNALLDRKVSLSMDLF